MDKFNIYLRENIELAAWLYCLVCIVLCAMGMFAKWAVIDGASVGKTTFFVVLALGLLASLPLSWLVTKMWRGIDNANGKEREHAHMRNHTQPQRSQPHKRASATLTDKTLTNLCWRADYRRVLKITTLILIFWVPYIIIRFPGNLDPDTTAQAMQTYGSSPLLDHHPYFDTLLFGAFWKFGDLVGTHAVPLFIYCGIQMFLTALSFSYAVLYCANRGVSHNVRAVIIVFYALYPFVVLSAQTMTKDPLYSWIFVFFFVFFAEIVFTRGKVFSDNAFIVVFVLVALASMLTKKTGVYVFFLSMVIVFFFSKNKLRLVVATLVPVLLFSFVWSSVLLGAWGVSKGEQREMLSVSSQQVGYILRDCSESITDEDWRVLEGVYTDARNMGVAYVPYRADATKDRWINNAPSENKRAFASWYMKQYIKHPRQMILAFLALDYPLLSVDVDTMQDESLLVYRNNVPVKTNKETLQSDGASVAGDSGKSEYDLYISCYRFNIISRISNAFDSAYLKVAESCAVLFSKVLFATWIPLFVVFYALGRKVRSVAYNRKHGGENKTLKEASAQNKSNSGRNKRLVLIAVPVLLCTATLAVGPIVLPRYMITSVYVAPILLAMLFVPSRKNVTEQNASKSLPKRKRAQKSTNNALAKSQR